MLSRRRWTVVTVLLALSMFLSACATPTPQIIEVTREVEVPVEVEKEVEVVVTREVEVEKEVIVTATPEPEAHAKYIFLFIGDGMGVAQRNAAELYLATTANPDARPKETRLLINSFPAQGMNTTYDLTSVIPDSASTATALASGQKTASGVVGMDATGEVVLKNISEIAKEHGWKVGVVSSVSLDHATPASFCAHVPSRGDYRGIAEALVTSEYDYFAGGILKRPATSNDKSEELPDVYEIAEENGFTVARGKAELEALTPGTKALAVVDYRADGEAMYYAMDTIPENNISLSDFVAKGIELLDNPDGFFMMVEGGKIDWACHGNDAAASIHDTIAFDNAVAEAYEFYKAHPDETLIVVTGDHETGGMTIGFAGTGYSSYIHKIAQQSISFVMFSEMVAEWREAGNMTFEDTIEAVEESFGLIVLTADERAVLTAKAEEGDKEAEAVLGMALSDLELDILRTGFERSMQGEEERPNNEYEYLLYGGYEPFVMKLTTILNQKAGISWTSYSHTGVPVQTSAIGIGAERFNGYYDQTDINVAMMEIAGFSSMAAASW